VAEFIARENIRRFRAQLELCADEQQKAVLAGLLETERERLRAVRAERRGRSHPPALRGNS
jgi:hypothetical protein